MPPGRTRDDSLSLVRSLEPVLAGKLVNLLGSTRTVRVLFGLGSLAVLAVDPVQDRGKDLKGRWEGKQKHAMPRERGQVNVAAACTDLLSPTFQATSNSSSLTKFE